MNTVDKYELGVFFPTDAGITFHYAIYRSGPFWGAGHGEIRIQGDALADELDRLPTYQLLLKGLDLNSWINGSRPQLSNKLSDLLGQITTQSEEAQVKWVSVSELVCILDGCALEKNQGKLKKAESHQPDLYELAKLWAEQQRKDFASVRKDKLEAVLNRHGRACKYCGDQESLCVDHDVPISKGGTNDIANLVPICRSCNSRKGNRPFIQLVGGTNES